MEQAQKEARCSAEPPPLWEDKPPRQVEIELRSAHGSGAAERRKRHEARRRQIIGERIRFALMAACVVVAGVSLPPSHAVMVSAVAAISTNTETNESTCLEIACFLIVSVSFVICSSPAGTRGIRGSFSGKTDISTRSFAVTFSERTPMAFHPCGKDTDGEYN